MFKNNFECLKTIIFGFKWMLLQRKQMHAVEQTNAFHFAMLKSIFIFENTEDGIYNLE